MANMEEIMRLAASWGPFALQALREIRTLDADYRVPMAHHAVEVGLSKEQHKQEVKLAREHFDGDQKLSQQLYFMQT